LQRKYDSCKTPSLAMLNPITSRLQKKPAVTLNKYWSCHLSCTKYTAKYFPEDRAIIDKWQETRHSAGTRWNSRCRIPPKPRKWRHFRFVREERPWTAMTASFACRFELASSYFAEAKNFLSKRGPFLQPWKTGNLRTPALSLKKIEDKRETRRP